MLILEFRRSTKGKPGATDIQGPWSRGRGAAPPAFSVAKEAGSRPWVSSRSSREEELASPALSPYPQIFQTQGELTEEAGPESGLLGDVAEFGGRGFVSNQTVVE